MNFSPHISIGIAMNLQWNLKSAHEPVSEIFPAPLTPRRLQCYGALLLCDALALVSAFAIAGWSYLGRDGMDLALRLLPIIMPALTIIALYNGSYSLEALCDWKRGAMRVVAALLQGSAVVVFVAFYTKSSADFSRIAFTVGVVLSVVFLGLGRVAVDRFVRWRCGFSVVQEVVILDGGPAVAWPGARVVEAAELGLTPSLDDPYAVHRIGDALRNADRVAVSCPPERRKAWTTILKGANVEGEVLDEAVDELSAHGAHISHGHGWLRVSVGPLGFRARVLKRLFDVTLASMALVLLAPLFVLIGLAILIEDSRPVMFIQRRIGRGNRFFSMYKFRSMRWSHADTDGHTSTRWNDERVTMVGNLIRRTSLDELPQLWNVLVGDMSLVGPRPHAIGSHAGQKLFWHVDSRYWHRHALRPGLTGLAQIRGLRGPTHEEADLIARLDADLEYLSNWSLWRDMRILLATVRVLIHHRAF